MRLDVGVAGADGGDLALLLVVQARPAVSSIESQVAAALPLLVVGEQQLVLLADLAGQAVA